MCGYEGSYSNMRDCDLSLRNACDKNHIKSTETPTKTVAKEYLFFSFFVPGKCIIDFTVSKIHI